MSTPDDTPTLPYARCKDCGEEFADRPAAHAHLAQTHPAELGKSSHSIQVVNPTPEESARNRIVSEIDSALDDCVRHLERLIERGTITKDHINTTLDSYPDFADAWDTYVKDNEL